MPTLRRDSPTAHMFATCAYKHNHLDIKWVGECQTVLNCFTPYAHTHMHTHILCYQWSIELNLKLSYSTLVCISPILIEYVENRHGLLSLLVCWSLGVPLFLYATTFLVGGVVKNRLFTLSQYCGQLRALTWSRQLRFSGRE